MSKGNLRRQNRSAALQFLYQWEINPPENLRFEIQQFFERQEYDRDKHGFTEELIEGVIEHCAELDERIKGHIRNWDFNRVARIDLTILRMATFELLHRPDIPPVVTIDEAIELSKTFSASESRRFVNGILDKVRSELDRPSRTAAI